MILSRTAAAIAAELAGGRRRVEVGHIRALLYAAEPHVQFDLHRRRRLREVIDELVAGGRIVLPRGKAHFDRREAPPLPTFVRLVGERATPGRRQPDAATYPWLPELRWAASLRPPLRNDEMSVLRRVSAFVAAHRGQALPVVPIQERSLELFGDEKRLSRMRGNRLFAPGRLSLEMLACREVHPPFVYKALSDRPVLLAIENSATYDSITRVLDATGPIGTVAYGAGNHFVLSVAAARDLDPVPQRILYFGDVDPEGLAIPVRANRTAARRGLPVVEPAAALYELLFDIAWSGGEAGADARLAWLPERLRGRAAGVLAAGTRLAQEHVGLAVLQRDPRWQAALRCQLG